MKAVKGRKTKQIYAFDILARWSAMMFLGNIMAAILAALCFPALAFADEFGKSKEPKKYIACRQLADVVLNEYAPPLNEAVAAISESIKKATHRAGRITISAGSAGKPDRAKNKRPIPPKTILQKTISSKNEAPQKLKPASNSAHQESDPEESYIDFTLDSIATPDFGQVVLTFQTDIGSSRISLQNEVRRAFDKDEESFSQISLWWRVEFF